ncbi:MAG: STAS domain-containing protein [Crocinitomicaceae bacterium]|nr:STAS domain-containing protein [Crocinitomicaceae bacterium]
MNLKYEIEIQDLVVIYKLSGKITTETDYEELETAVFSKLNKNYYRIIFDLTNLTHTNSSGISLFMRTLTKSRIMGGELVLTHISGNVEKIFQISKLDEIYTICENNVDAINHFKTLQ